MSCETQINEQTDVGGYIFAILPAQRSGKCVRGSLSHTSRGRYSRAFVCPRPISCFGEASQHMDIDQ